jgi:hypothetical protein
MKNQAKRVWTIQRCRVAFRIVALIHQPRMSRARPPKMNGRSWVFEHYCLRSGTRPEYQPCASGSGAECGLPRLPQSPLRGRPRGRRRGWPVFRGKTRLNASLCAGQAHLKWPGRGRHGRPLRQRGQPSVSRRLGPESGDPGGRHGLIYCRLDSIGIHKRHAVGSMCYRALSYRRSTKCDTVIRR